MNMPLALLNRRRRGAVAFSPTALFALAEPGVWYDPSDVANLDWRRNLLTWTEQFDNAVWQTGPSGTGSVTKSTVNAAVAPDDTTTADRVLFSLNGGTTTSDIALLRQANSTTGNLTHSVYVRSFDGMSSYVMQVISPDGTGQNITVTGAWQRFSVSATSSGSVNYGIRLRGGQTPSNSDSADVLIWGAQLELGSVATEYQRITDVNTEVIERFPSATLYQDTAGTTPVTTPGQTVALALDKSKGLVLGPELVTNGDFATDTNWTKGSGWTISGGVASANIAAGVNLDQSLTTTINKSYVVTFTITSYTSGSIRARFTGTANISGSFRSAAGTYTEILHATATNTTFRITDGGGGFIGTIDNISVKELPGFHATQATTASRPIYGINPVGGRRNLLTRTEEFENAAWTKTRSSVTANAGVAPDGTTTADKLVEDTNVNNSHLTIQTLSGSATGAYTCSVYAKSAERSRIVVTNQENTTNGVFAVFNLGTGAIDVAATAFGTGFSGASATITSVGNGWYRCSVSATASVTTRSISINLDNATSGAISQTYTGNGTSGALIWGAQLETGSTATAYQRVTTQYDVTEAGVSSLSYLAFDGVDDFLVTPTITPGIDKAQVFAGVRKLSDAATTVLLEHSATVNSNNGSFGLFAPQNTGVANYGFNSKGTVASVATATGFTAPITSVLTSLGDIAADTSTLRVNGTQVAQNTADQGSGNYLAYPLYIGRRGGTTLPFSGNIYSLIVRFGANLTADQITSTETWVNGKTRAY